MVDTIKKQDPFSISLIVEPAANQLKYIGLGIFPPRNLESVCNIPTTLLETVGIACVDP